MEDKKKEKLILSTESYKGVRDFLPEDWHSELFIFDTWRKIAKSFGYEEYNASVIEPLELYLQKSGEEIAIEQTYNFKDKGNREVALRPEMTPTVARLVAGIRKSAIFPIRWFSIPNLFRYEKPQKGRLREHWQFNADLFGIPNPDGEVEIISLAYEIMSAFGLKNSDFEIRINNREIIDFLLKNYLKLSPERSKQLASLIDRKDKIQNAEFESKLDELVQEKKEKLKAILGSNNLEEFIANLPEDKMLEKPVSETKTIVNTLSDLGITNIHFTSSLIRGFDYYTGVIFEIYDTNPENPRSICGGGRYDKLLEIFDAQSVPTVGFGMGDVTLLEMLTSRGLTPAYKNPAIIAICVVDRESILYANSLARKLRKAGLGAIIDHPGRKISDQIKYANKKNIPYVICVGEDEVKSGTLKIKDLSSGTEVVLREEAVIDFIEHHQIDQKA
jgi:histidyl-tRNA synthetase